MGIEFKETGRRVGTASFLFPYKRDQDCIIYGSCGSEPSWIASVMDGWNHRDFLKELGDGPGREVAKFVGEAYPRRFLASDKKDPKERARLAAWGIDEECLRMYPAHASCVGAFLFELEGKQVVVAVGSVCVWYWDGGRWVRPKEIGNYSLDPAKYPSDVARFFGRGELKGDPLYSPEPDVAIIEKGKPLVIATDGVEQLMTPEEMGSFTKKFLPANAVGFMKELRRRVEGKREQQIDDAAVLVAL